MTIIKKAYIRYYIPIVPQYNEETKNSFVDSKIISPWTELIDGLHGQTVAILTSVLRADKHIDILGLSQFSSILESGLVDCTDTIALDNLEVNNFYFLIDGKVVSYKPNQVLNKFSFQSTKSYTRKAFNQFSFNLQDNPFVIETEINLELGEFFTSSNQPEQYLGMTLNGFRENLNRR